MQKIVKAIAVRSLRRWDAFLGFRAGHDGLGRTLGVWKDKFDGVRFAVLLLAMRKLNEQLKLQHGASGKQSLYKSFAQHVLSASLLLQTWHLLLLCVTFIMHIWL